MNERTVNLLPQNSKTWTLARAFHPGTLSATLLLFCHYCLICDIILKTGFHAQLQSWMHHCIHNMLQNAQRHKRLKSQTTQELSNAQAERITRKSRNL